MEAGKKNFGGYELPAGATVAPVILLVHRREDVYPEPDGKTPPLSLLSMNARIAVAEPGGKFHALAGGYGCARLYDLIGRRFVACQMPPAE